MCQNHYKLSSIVNIAEAANEGRFMDIDNDTTLGEVLRWKIAFLYSHKQLIPINTSLRIQLFFSTEKRIKRVNA